MAKQKTQFSCTTCGNVSSAWSGKCFNCNEWGTIEQSSGSDGNSVTLGKGIAVSGSFLSPTSVNAATKSRSSVQRLLSGYPEVDTILGGGFFPGSVTLLAGQPGVGKSTILLQIAEGLCKKSSVMYVSGEESEAQISDRAKRLKVKLGDSFHLIASHSADDIAATIVHLKPDFVIVDSIQTVATELANGNQGGVAQIVGSTQVLTNTAKKTGCSMLLVGHVTKEGTIAGPKVLEHLVDVVLQLSSDKFAHFTLLRASKNRYGTTSEVSILEMTPTGLEPVENPSAVLLEQRQLVDGSVIFAAMEGAQPLLLEIQALTSKTAYGYPKRTSVGFNLNRLNVLIAVLEKRTKLKLSEYDIYISVAGGVQIDDPAADLAVCLAIASAVAGYSLSPKAVVFGEVGLGGEIRKVSHADKRSKESKKLGFTQVIQPEPGGHVRTMLTKYLSKVV